MTITGRDIVEILIAFGLAIVVGIFLIFPGLIIAIARADDPHSHGVNVPDWYDASCCNQHDCRPIEDSEIAFDNEPLQGVVALYKYRGGFLKFYKNRNQFRVSKDERYHVCFNPNITDDEGKPKTYCIYDRDYI